MVVSAYIPLIGFIVGNTAFEVRCYGCMLRYVCNLCRVAVSRRGSVFGAYIIMENQHFRIIKVCRKYRSKKEVRIRLG